MTYSVKEIFYTLQGEGAQAGRAAVFLRFAGCNLWSSLAKDRASAICKFCDTDFVGTDGTNGGKFPNAQSLASAVGAHWPSNVTGRPYVVCTGGEPLLQLDDLLVAALHEQGFESAIETNGTLMPPTGIDWICVAPRQMRHKRWHGAMNLSWSILRPILRVTPIRISRISSSNLWITMIGPLIPRQLSIIAKPTRNGGCRCSP